MLLALVCVAWCQVVQLILAIGKRLPTRVGSEQIDACMTGHHEPFPPLFTSSSTFQATAARLGLCLDDKDAPYLCVLVSIPNADGGTNATQFPLREAILCFIASPDLARASSKAHKSVRCSSRVTLVSREAPPCADGSSKSR